MLGELQRRNFAPSTIRYYIRTVRDFAAYFKEPLDQLGVEELRQFQLHMLRDQKLATGFPRVRYFGFLANRRRGVFLPLCRTLLAAAPSADVPNAAEPAVWHCPRCQGLLRVVEFLTAQQIFTAEVRSVPVHDTS